MVGDVDLVGNVELHVALEGGRGDVAGQASPHAAEDAGGRAVSEDGPRPSGLEPDRDDALEGEAGLGRPAHEGVELLVEPGGLAAVGGLRGDDLTEHGQGIAWHSVLLVLGHLVEDLGGVQEDGDELGINRRGRLGACDDAADV